MPIPNPSGESTYQQAAESIIETLAAFGYQRVHTWHESHGGSTTHILQNGTYPQVAQFLHVDLDHVSKRTKICTHKAQGDHLFAAMLEDPTNEIHDTWLEIGKPRISGCCTASYRTFVHRWASSAVQLCSVVGHGSWTTELTGDTLAATLSQRTALLKERKATSQTAT